MKFVCGKCGKEFGEYSEALEHERICGLPESEIGRLSIAKVDMERRKLSVKRLVMPQEQLLQRGFGKGYPYFNGVEYYNEGATGDEKKVIDELLFFALMKESEMAKEHTDNIDWIVEQKKRQAGNEALQS